MVGYLGEIFLIGTGFEATQHRSYVTYEEARKIAKEENITKGCNGKISLNQKI